MRKTKFYEVFWFDLDIRDFRTEVIETTSLKAAQQYGREVERDSDHLKFRWAQGKQD